MRAIPGIGSLLRKVNEVVLFKFIPSITGGIVITENERMLLFLAAWLGGLGLPIFKELLRKIISKFHHNIRTSLLLHYWLI